MKIIAIIPSRYASTRFPAKSLAMIHGESMIQRVYNQALKAKLLSDVIIATDHADIENHVKSFGGKVVMTDPNHPSGTDRIFEALEKTGSRFDAVINIQGDEPFIHPEVIDSLAKSFQKPDVQIATMANPIKNEADLFNPNVVKIVLNANNFALYFSRSPIPFNRNLSKNQWVESETYYRHLGIYGYRTAVLRKIISLPLSRLEKIESLEQLRWLENGFSIKVEITPYESVGIDTPEDLAAILENIKIQ